MSNAPEKGLTHVAADGKASMVDVGSKPETARTAIVSGQIRMQPETLGAIMANGLAKGDVLAVARVAGVMAAKKTSELIPLCHPLPLTDIQVELVPDPSLPGIRVQATVRTVGRTGVEMEALTAATIALLTVYDMAKAMDRGMAIEGVKLDQKTGGASGAFSRG
jgi:cyclic pyranopterin phosphate synthase